MTNEYKEHISDMEIGECFKVDILYKAEKTKRWTVGEIILYQIIGKNEGGICIETYSSDGHEGFSTFKKKEISSVLKDDKFLHYSVLPISLELFNQSK